MRDEEIYLLKILAEGFRKHPAYRARRRPAVECEPCAIMWKARVALNELELAKTPKPKPPSN